MRVILLLLSVCALACGPAIEPKLSVLQEEVFRPSCGNASCHGGPNPVRALRLDDIDRAALVEGQASDDAFYVVPSDPDASLLYLALVGETATARQMPPSLPIGEEKAEAVRQWIASGAADD